MEKDGSAVLEKEFSCDTVVTFDEFLYDFLIGHVKAAILATKIQYLMNGKIVSMKIQKNRLKIRDGFPYAPNEKSKVFLFQKVQFIRIMSNRFKELFLWSWINGTT